MKSLISLVMLVWAFSVTAHAEASKCNSSFVNGEHRIVTDGTFLLSTNGRNAYVSSYLPAGTVVTTQGTKDINYHKRDGMPPIPQCYFKIKTNLGKIGYILDSESETAVNYPGKYLFPRTEIEIYKRPNKTKVDKYKNKLIEKNEVVMSSTYPKIKEKLHVIGMDKEQDFYTVKAEFLGEGRKGFIYADDIEKGDGIIIDSDKLEFFDRTSVGTKDSIKSTLKKLLGDKVYKELDERLSEYTQNVALEICKIHLTVTPYAEVSADAWWISGGVRVEGEVSIKAANRSYVYETHEIIHGSANNEIELIKHIECDSEDMLYPIMAKVKYKDEVLTLPRDNFSGLGKLLRKKSDPRNKGQYKKILTVRNYGDWIQAYQHVDSSFSDWKPAFGDTYSVLLDILVDSISYYPPSKKRVVIPQTEQAQPLNVSEQQVIGNTQ